MRLLHLADLHIGKRVNEFSMIEDQIYILKQILEIADKQNLDGVLLCGDIYDKTIPPTEAVNVLDDFLASLHRLGLPTYMISGNHDSADRLNFGHGLFEESNVFIYAQFDGTIKTYELQDAYGDVIIHMLPFVKPNIINHFLGTELKSYDEAIKEVLARHSIDKTKRNILLAHQFVSVNGKHPDESESETKAVGGLDNIDYHLFDDYDYVALGHIHKPQAMGRQQVRYSGSILKYSFSEANIDKTITILDIEEKGKINIETIPLKPLHDMKEITCTIQELLDKKTLQECPADSYVHVILSDEEEIIDASDKVRSIYPNMMLITLKNKRTKQLSKRKEYDLKQVDELSPMDLFNDFYEWQNNINLSDKQVTYLEKILKEVGDKS